MKQTYLKPDSTIVKIQLQQMIALSMNSEQKVNENTVVLGRAGGDAWDDEE